MNDAQVPEWLGRLADANKRIAELERIIGKQEEELHQGELRIAELTAQLAEARYRIDCMIDDHDVTRAELAALKGRTCETCLHWRGFTDMGLGVGDCEATKRFCITNQLHTPDTFACSWWAARAEEGGGDE